MEKPKKRRITPVLVERAPIVDPLPPVEAPLVFGSSAERNVAIVAERYEHKAKTGHFPETTKAEFGRVQGGRNSSVENINDIIRFYEEDPTYFDREPVYAEYRKKPQKPVRVEEPGVKRKRASDAVKARFAGMLFEKPESMYTTDENRQKAIQAWRQKRGYEPHALLPNDDLPDDKPAKIPRNPKEPVAQRAPGELKKRAMAALQGFMADKPFQLDTSEPPSKAPHPIAERTPGELKRRAMAAVQGFVADKPFHGMPTKAAKAQVSAFGAVDIPGYPTGPPSAPVRLAEPPRVSRPLFSSAPEIEEVFPDFFGGLTQQTPSYSRAILDDSFLDLTSATDAV